MARKQSNLDLRNGVWQGRVIIAGRRHRCSLHTSDAREAKIRLAEWIKQLEHQAYRKEPDAPTFRAAVVKWGEEVLPNAVKPQVARRYLTSVKSLDTVMGHVPVNHITGKMIAQYISSRTKTATGKIGAGVSNATLKRDLTALSRLLSACAAWGWITDNPAKNFDRSIIREKREPINLVRDEDLKLVLDRLPAPMAELLSFLDQTGMRLNEAVTLEKGQVTKDRQQITLTKTKTNRPRVLAWKTFGGDATPFLATPKHAGKSYLFVNDEGNPYSNFSSNFGQVVRRLMAEALENGTEFRRFRVHDMRHMFAIRWLRNGGNIYKLSKHLGHTSVKTTEIYLDYLDEAEQEVARHQDSAVSDVIVNGPQNRPHAEKKRKNGRSEDRNSHA